MSDSKHPAIVEKKTDPSAGEQPKIGNGSHQKTVEHVKSRQNRGGAE